MIMIISYVTYHLHAFCCSYHVQVVNLHRFVLICRLPLLRFITSHYIKSGYEQGTERGCVIVFVCQGSSVSMQYATGRELFSGVLSLKLNCST